MSVGRIQQYGTPNFGIDKEDMEDQLSDSELLDELTTHRRELKVRTEFS